MTKHKRREYELVVQVATACKKCGCTDTDPQERGPSVQEFKEVQTYRPTGQRYSKRVIRQKRCSQCGQWRNEITYELPAAPKKRGRPRKRKAEESETQLTTGNIGQ